MKTLANCNPVEFLVQTNKIKKATENWINLTKVKEIMNVDELPADMLKEEKIKVRSENIKKNFMHFLDTCLEEYPQQTAELLGLICFVEPKDLSRHTMAEFMGNISEIINCQEVIDFFTSLAQLGVLDISKLVKK